MSFSCDVEVMLFIRFFMLSICHLVCKGILSSEDNSTYVDSLLFFLHIEIQKIYEQTTNLTILRTK